ncbi:MAG: TRAP transporter small permease subunit [Bacteroidia bacterium]|nr:TRAP transporter small permease subunit [Bacteroidia bacterium]
MKRIIRLLENLIEKVGRLISLLSLALVVVICADVLMRYLFNFTKIWVIELETYFFTFLFLWGSAYAFKHDKHVRVDVFYQRFSKKTQAWINLIGALFLLLPWCVVVMMVSWPYLFMSWKISETSAQAGGLGNLFLLKGSIFTGFFFLLLQALVSVFRSIQVIIDKKPQAESLA